MLGFFFVQGGKVRVVNLSDLTRLLLSHPAMPRIANGTDDILVAASAPRVALPPDECG